MVVIQVAKITAQRIIPGYFRRALDLQILSVREPETDELFSRAFNSWSRHTVIVIQKQTKSIVFCNTLG